MQLIVYFTEHYQLSFFFSLPLEYTVLKFVSKNNFSQDTLEGLVGIVFYLAIIDVLK